MRNKFNLSNEQKQYLKSILRDYSSKEVIKLMRDKYNIQLNINYIKNRRRDWNIKRKENLGQFKKGCIPHNKINIGEEVYIKCSGEKRYFIKIKDRKGKKGLYKSKERYIYEKYIGKIPKGYKVMHLNGNLNDFSLDNLYLVKQGELFTMFLNKMFTNNKELTKTNVLIARLLNKTKKIRSDYY